MTEEANEYYLKDSCAERSNQNTFPREHNNTKATESEFNKEKMNSLYDDCPSLYINSFAYSSSDDEDFNSAINHCSENDTKIGNIGNYASAPTNIDNFGIGVSTPDVRRSSINSIGSYKTENFDLTCRSLPENEARTALLLNNETKAINKVGTNIKIQKNDNILLHRGRISSIPNDVSHYQSAFKNKRLHSTMSTCSRSSMHFSRHF